MTVPRLLLGANTPAPDPDAIRAAEDRARQLNDRYRHHAARAIMDAALSDIDDIALVSSFGAESVVLLHMAAIADPSVPVLFIDTDMLFAETLTYQLEVTERLGLTGVRVIRAAQDAAFDPDRILHQTQPDTCCAVRKTRPLQEALAGYQGWITGRKRFQTGTRAVLDLFEVEDGTARLKVNPLAHWAPDDVRAYMDENRLPRHPLVARGYPSIGCAPCTSPVRPGEAARAGRWRNSAKDECGIHIVNGKLVRKGVQA